MRLSKKLFKIGKCPLVMLRLLVTDGWVHEERLMHELRCWNLLHECRVMGEQSLVAINKCPHNSIIFFTNILWSDKGYRRVDQVILLPVVKDSVHAQIIVKNFHSLGRTLAMQFSIFDI